MGSNSFADRILELILIAWAKLPELILTFIVGYIAIKLLKALLHGAIGFSRANAALKGVLISVVDIVLWMMLLAILLHQVGLTQISLALSGTVIITGLALSVGSSVLVQDLMAGIFLSQDPDFRTGDYVKIGDVEGMVERMDARKIRLRDKKGVLHVYPNSYFDKNSWMVLKREG